MDLNENDGEGLQAQGASRAGPNRPSDLDRSSRQVALARMASTVATLAIFALPVSLCFSRASYIYGKIPFLKQLGFRPASSKSAVLAVDVSGLTIQSKSGSEETAGEFERAAVAHLANLHRTYNAWAENHQDLSGTLLVRLRVDNSGSVSRVDPLAVRLSNDVFTRTVISEIRRWSFPAGASEPVEITMPLLFVPKGLDTNTVVRWERKSRAAQPLRMARDDGAGLAANAGSPQSRTFSTAPLDKRRQEALDRTAAPVPTKSEAGKPHVEVLRTTRAVGLRPTPRYSAPRVYEIDANTELSLLETQGDWVKVQVANAEHAGFVRRELLAPLD